MSTGACTGVEALIRWRHPERGLVPPSEFIPLAEQTALIGPLTDLVLRMALLQASAWKEQGRPLSIAVNVSIRNLEDGSFPLKIASLLATYGVHPSALEIEVTETGLMSAQNKVINALQSLRQLGVKVALDDFGVGQSSLAYLRNLPADVLKLDRSFIHDVSRDTKDQTIVQAIIGAAHKLEFEVVAEGIEDEPTYERLRSFACDFGQGYFIARPLSSTDFDGWLAARFQSGQYVWH